MMPQNYWQLGCFSLAVILFFFFYIGSRHVVSFSIQNKVAALKSLNRNILPNIYCICILLTVNWY